MRTTSWRRVAKALQALLAHSLLFSFTLFLTLKLEHTVSYSWWVVFVPLWLFHVVVARRRFSLPAPYMPHDRHWAPFHAIMATPLLVAFELLSCVYLENKYAVNLKIVFLPLLAIEIAILVDNIRMCRALMPRDEESMSDEAIWETLPHFWVAISMVFFIAATTFTLLKLCGDIAALGWWDIFINMCIAEGFGFLVCTRWYNPAIHRHSYIREPSSSLSPVRFLDWNSDLIVSSDDDQHQCGICNLQDIGGHIMKIPVIIFQILLFMRLEGTPPSARHLSFPVVFGPLFLLQGAGVLFAAYRFVEKIIILPRSGVNSGRYFTISLKVCECFGFLHHGSRLLGWWSIDEGSLEEQARLYCASASGPWIACVHSLFQSQIWRLQDALGEQTEITSFSRQEYERLQNEKILCRICFEDQINVVLLPCRHHAVCSMCSERCKKCPICRAVIEERVPVSGV